MTDYERIKELRKHLKLSQTDFATKIGVTRGVIANIEAGLVEIKDYVLKLICSVFNVNEEWILTGAGEMFAKSKQTMLDDLVSAHGLTEKETAIVSAFLDLSPAGRSAIIEYVEKAARGLSSVPVSSAPTRDEIINNDIVATEKKIQEITKKEV